MLPDIPPTPFTASLTTLLGLLSLSMDNRMSTVLGVIIIGVSLALIISLALDYSYKHHGNEPGEYFWTSDKHPEI